VAGGGSNIHGLSQVPGRTDSVELPGRNCELSLVTLIYEMDESTFSHQGCWTILSGF